MREKLFVIVCRTFQEHTGRVFRLQFDEFQIVSSSHDDTILIWDFLNYESQAGSSNHTNNNNNAIPYAMHLNLAFTPNENQHEGLFALFDSFVFRIFGEVIHVILSELQNLKMKRKSLGQINLLYIEFSSGGGTHPMI